MIRLFIASNLFVSLPLIATADDHPARSFVHSVTTKAARVQPSTGDKDYVSIRCLQAGASPVYLGGKDVPPKNGYAICTTTPGGEADHSADAGAMCQSDFVDLDVTDLYAVVSSSPGATSSPAMQSLSCIAVQ